MKTGSIFGLNMTHSSQKLNLSFSVEFDQEDQMFVAINPEFGLEAKAKTEAQVINDLMSILKAHLVFQITEKKIPKQRLAHILAFATEVIENKDAAMKWLSRPQFGLGGAIPIEMLQTEEGAEEVENLLGRIQYGVYS